MFSLDKCARTYDGRLLYNDIALECCAYVVKVDVIKCINILALLCAHFLNFAGHQRIISNDSHPARPRAIGRHNGSDLQRRRQQAGILKLCS